VHLLLLFVQRPPPTRATLFPYTTSSDLKHGARQIALLEIDELALIKAEAELRRDFPQIQYVPVLGDCGDPAVARYALEQSRPDRSEEHTSELQSRENLVCRLLLEKKNEH